MIIGEDATTNWLGNNFAHLQLQSDQVENKLAMVTYSTTESTGNRLWAYRGKGNKSTPAAVDSDDELLSIGAFGRLESSFSESSEIRFRVDETPNQQATYVPGRIEFLTATASSQPEERLRIGSTGEIKMSGSLTLPLYAVEGQNTTYDVKDTDHTILSTAIDQTINLPDPAGIIGRIYVIKKASNFAGNTTIVPLGTDVKIEQQTNLLLIRHGSLLFYRQLLHKLG